MVIFESRFILWSLFIKAKIYSVLLSLILTLSIQAGEISQNQSLDIDSSSVESFISNLNQQYPNKTIYLDFWASWCGPCRKSFPFMNKLHSKYAENLVVIAVNEDENQSLADKYLKKYPAAFEIIYDSSGKIATTFDLVAMPSSYIISEDGELIGKHAGFRKGDDINLEAALVKYLQQTKQQKKLLNLDTNEDTK